MSETTDDQWNVLHSDGETVMATLKHIDGGLSITVAPAFATHAAMQKLVEGIVAIVHGLLLETLDEEFEERKQQLCEEVAALRAQLCDEDAAASLSEKA